MNKFFLLIFILILPLTSLDGQKFDPLKGTKKVEKKRQRIRKRNLRQTRRFDRPINRIIRKEERIYESYLKENRKKHLNNQDLKTRERIENHLKETEKYYRNENYRLCINRLIRPIYGNK